MMPVIRLNDATFGDLKSVSTWFGTKTPSETIDRLVRQAMDELGLERDGGVDVPLDAKPDDRLVFEKTPGLSFTRVLSASVNGQHYDKLNWAGLLHKVVSLVHAKGLTGQRLVNELQVPAKATEYTDEGYKFDAALGVSMQGQSAPEAWKEASRLATKFGIPIEVHFQWRENEKAQHPGRIGILRAAMK